MFFIQILMIKKENILDFLGDIYTQIIVPKTADITESYPVCSECV